MVANIGDYNASFRVGGYKALQEKPYQFNLAKQENYYRTFYSVANTYVLYVTSEPVTINVVTDYTLPIGGCSLPVTISVRFNLFFLYLPIL